VTNHWIDSQTFWRDKRVIVTGGAGFLGTYVVQKLHARGAAEITKVTSGHRPAQQPVRPARHQAVDWGWLV